MRLKRVFLSCFFGGVGLYIVELLLSLLPYTMISDLVYRILLISCISIGAVISVFVLLYKSKSLRDVLIRFFVLLASYAIIFIISGYLGTVNRLFVVLGISESSANNNVSGMLTLTFVFSIICVCVVIIAVVAIRNFIRKR